MSREFPDIVDPWKAADGKRTFRGSVPISRMKRLEELLAPSASGERGEAAFVMHFAYDEQGLVTIATEVDAGLELICQRSLALYVEEVARRSMLVVIEDVGEQEEMPESYEPVLVEGRRVALASLVEEELLLAVPQVPRAPHSDEIEFSTDGGAETRPSVGSEPTHKPFAGLAGLIKENETK